MSGDRDSDKAALPWSVKGVSAEARELAKRMAAEQGLTMGEWLSKAIRSGGEGPPDQGPVQDTAQDSTAAPAAATETLPAVREGPSVPQPAAQGADSAAMSDGVIEHVRTMERRVLDVVGPLHEIVEHLSSRLERLERRGRDRTG